MTWCSLLVLEEDGLKRFNAVTKADLNVIYWRRINDYSYAFDGPFTVREALRRLETLIGQYLYAVDKHKNPLFEVHTKNDVARGRELLCFTGRRSRHNFFHRLIRYEDKCACLTEAEMDALVRGKWEPQKGIRIFEKEVWFKHDGLDDLQIKNLGIDDWEKLLPNRHHNDLKPGIEEWERCGTCSFHLAHHFE